MTSVDAPKIHPFEKSGLGIGPFRFLAVISLPAPSLQEANPTAYNNALRDAFASAKGFGVGLGSCEHCGQGLAHNAVIKGTGADSKPFVIGLDCLQKIDKASLGSKAKVAQAKIRREVAEARKEAKRQAWLAADCGNGETNAQRVERERQERNAAWEAEKANAEQQRQDALDRRGVRGIIEELRRAGGEFFISLAQQLERGSLSPRQADCVCKFLLGGRHTKANADSWDQHFNLLTASN